jgi:hypothetical protein
MPACAIDHIVIGAASLEDGAHFIRERLGVDMPMGGKHENMGTHNRLMRLGSASYLEVIAINPDAPPPARPRWFALDDPMTRARLDECPRLITWVARTADIVAAVQSAAIPLGAVVPASRGALSWRLTIPADGHLPGGGVIPHLIEWDGGVRPWETMADFGCELEELTLAHPEPAWLDDALKSICAKGFEQISVEHGSNPALSVKVRRSDGTVVTL